MPDQLRFSIIGGPPAVYLLTHSHSAGEWWRLANRLSETPDIIHWMYFLPNSFLITTKLNAEQLGELIRVFAGDQAHFLVTRLTGGLYWGRLPAEVWPIVSGQFQPAEPPHIP
ncbi:MAG TPA: hypothetical protein VH092_01790 [Urbifossiella sp.]|jgi:hypothetical protein|nr:hypothetical protein [Urbifossiella sp.]